MINENKEEIREEEYRQEARDLERLNEEREFKDYIIDKLDHN